MFDNLLGLLCGRPVARRRRPRPKPVRFAGEAAPPLSPAERERRTFRIASPPAIPGVAPEDQPGPEARRQWQRCHSEPRT